MPYVLPQYVDPNKEFARDLLKQALLIAITKGASLPFQALGQVAKAGQYTSPTGASTMFSPAERVASNPNMSAAQLISQNAPAGAKFTPTQFGIGRVPDYAQEAARLAVVGAPDEARLAKAKADLYEKAAKGEIQFTTSPDGTLVPVLPTTSGGKAISDSGDELAKAMTTLVGAMGSTTTPQSEDRVKVKDKSGKVFSVPRIQLEEAQKQGYSLFE